MHILRMIYYLWRNSRGFPWNKSETTTIENLAPQPSDWSTTFCNTRRTANNIFLKPPTGVGEDTENYYLRFNERMKSFSFSIDIQQALNVKHTIKSYICTSKHTKRKHVW